MLYYEHHVTGLLIQCLIRHQNLPHQIQGHNEEVVLPVVPRPLISPRQTQMPLVNLLASHSTVVQENQQLRGDRVAHRFVDIASEEYVCLATDIPECPGIITRTLRLLSLELGVLVEEVRRAPSLDQGDEDVGDSLSLLLVPHEKGDEIWRQLVVLTEHRERRIRSKSAPARALQGPERGREGRTLLWSRGFLLGGR